MTWLLWVMLGGLVGLLISAAVLAVITGLKLGVWARTRSAATALPAVKSPHKRRRVKPLK